MNASARNGHYTRILKILVTSEIEVIDECSPEVIQSSVLGVLKAPGESMRLIWSGSRANFLFRQQAGACVQILSTFDF